KSYEAEKKATMLMELQTNTILVERAARSDQKERHAKLVAAQNEFAEAESGMGKLGITLLCIDRDPNFIDSLLILTVQLTISKAVRMDLKSAKERFEKAQRCVKVLDLVEKKLHDNFLESKASKDSWAKQPILLANEVTNSMLVMAVGGDDGGLVVGVVRNRVLVTKPQNKTPYELLHGRTPSIGFMRPFGYPVTILNTLDSLGKFKGKVDKGFLVGYSVNSKAFRVFIRKIGKEADLQYMLFPVWSTSSTNPQNKEVDATFNAKKPESTVNLSLSNSALSGEQDDITKKKDKGKSHVDYFTRNRDFNEDFEDFSEDSSNDVSAAGLIFPTARQNYSNNTNPISATGPIVNTAGQNYSNSTNPINAAGPSNSNTHGQSSLRDTYQPPDMVKKEDIDYFDHENVEEPKRVHQALKDPSWIEAMQEELLQLKMQKVWILVDLPHDKMEIARIEAIRLFLAYASLMGFMVYQIDVKSAFLYGTIEEEVYVCQPLGFEDPDHPDKVYKLVEALYGLHQAPRAWYETLANYLLENGFHREQIDQTLFIKKQKRDILLMQIYVDDIIFGATNKDLCKSFKKLMKDKF
nr:hypothetical protein [Tanacetum cinerariifolium]